MFRALAYLIVFFAVFGNNIAQESDSHLEAARSLMRALGYSKKGMIESFSGVVKKNEIEDSIDWNKLEQKVADFYKEQFTEKELNDLKTFFDSPVGKKYQAANLRSGLRELFIEFITRPIYEKTGTTPEEVDVLSQTDPTESMKRQNEMAAILAISTLRSMEKGNSDRAKAKLAETIARYYYKHLKGRTDLRGLDKLVKQKIEELEPRSDILKQQMKEKNESNKNGDQDLVP